MYKRFVKVSEPSLLNCLQQDHLWTKIVYKKSKTCFDFFTETKFGKAKQEEE